MNRDSESQEDILQLANTRIQTLVNGMDHHLRIRAERDVLRALERVRKKYEKSAGNRVGLRGEVRGVIEELPYSSIFRAEDVASHLRGESNLASIAQILRNESSLPIWTIYLLGGQKANSRVTHWLKPENPKPGRLRDFEDQRGFTDLSYSQRYAHGKYGVLIVDGVNKLGYFPAPGFDPFHSTWCTHTKEVEEFARFVDLSGLPTAKIGENVAIVYDPKRTRRKK